MNKELYLQKKIKAQQEVNFRDECIKCFRPKRACFCRDISPITTDTKIVILMHPTEMKKGHIGTGRLAHLSLSNSQIIVDIDFDKNSEFNNLIDQNQYKFFLLYPSETPKNQELISLIKDQKDEQKECVIFVIDATWPRAKMMMKKTKKLHNLPRVSLNIRNDSIFSIKQQPQNYCLSTIESIYHLLDYLKKNNCEDPELNLVNFLNPLKSLVSFHTDLAADETQNNYTRTSKSPKLKEQRIPSKKWETRNIFFKSNDPK